MIAAGLPVAGLLAAGGNVLYVGLLVLGIAVVQAYLKGSAQATCPPAERTLVLRVALTFIALVGLILGGVAYVRFG